MVSFDVDETIFRKPALFRAAHALGIGERWDAIDDMHDRRRISRRERLESHQKLLRGVKVADILREVSKVEVVKNVHPTIAELHGQQLRVVLLTDLPDFLCVYLVERFGFDDYVASKPGVRDGIVTGEIEPLVDKSLGLRGYCSSLSIPLSKCVHVGDGSNDVPVFRVVGYSIALNSRIEDVNASASYQMTTDDLLRVSKHLQTVV